MDFHDRTTLWYNERTWSPSYDMFAQVDESWSLETSVIMDKSNGISCGSDPDCYRKEVGKSYCKMNGR